MPFLPVCAWVKSQVMEATFLVFCKALMNVWQPEINERGVFTKISAGLGRWENVWVTALFQVFDVYVCMICMQVWLCVCERQWVRVDSKFKNIGTNEYFLSCGFSSLFCFIYCLNCNNYNKEKKIFLEDATNWRHSYWNMKHAKPYCTKLSWIYGCFRNT